MFRELAFTLQKSVKIAVNLKKKKKLSERWIFLFQLFVVCWYCLSTSEEMPECEKIDKFYLQYKCS